MKKAVLLCGALAPVLALLATFASTPAARAEDDLFKQFQATESNREYEDIEWTITYSMNCRQNDLPRVILIGDSIVCGYQKGVQDHVSGKMYESFWGSSKCVTDPDYLRELDLMLRPRHYDVIGFNNALHSFTSDFEEWKSAYRQTVKFIQAKCPDSKLLIILATPVANSDQNKQVLQMNEFMKTVAQEENLPIVDLYSVAESFPVENRWVDGVHFKDDAIIKEAITVGDAVLGLMGMAKDE